jgi:hypothetical protein
MPEEILNFLNDKENPIFIQKQETSFVGKKHLQSKNESIIKKPKNVLPNKSKFFSKKCKVK